jgi:phosphatidylethanolamine-binding protein (PEBP) family uncharacterized protein
MMTLRLSLPAFADGSPIPAKYTCEGEDISPPLLWSGIPDGATSLVLIVDDPDAPDPMKTSGEPALSRARYVKIGPQP